MVCLHAWWSHASRSDATAWLCACCSCCTARCCRLAEDRGDAAGRDWVVLWSCKELVDPVGPREQRLHVVVQNRELTCNCRMLVMRGAALPWHVQSYDKQF
eukprot:365266-Chlamydomonas_euryale.AAC.2